MSEEQQTGPQVVLQKIYLKDASVEVPNAPEIFAEEWRPKVDVQINTEVAKVAEDVHQVTLAVTVMAKQNDRTGYLVEVHQSGIFALRGFSQAQEQQAVLGAYCPNVVFPYARESVSDLIQRSGFPQFLLQPVNFDALFREYMKQAQDQAGPGGSAPH